MGGAGSPDGTPSANYGSISGDTCPTCRGTGRIPRGHEDTLVAVIPCNDVRLKPRHTKLHVCISMGMCLFLSSLILYFLFPRSVALTPMSVQSVMVYFTPKAVKMEVTNVVKIVNENYVPVQIVELDIQGLVLLTIMGKSKIYNMTSINSRTQKMTMNISYLSHNEQLTMTTYEYIDCGNNSTTPHTLRSQDPSSPPPPSPPPPPPRPPPVSKRNRSPLLTRVSGWCERPAMGNQLTDMAPGVPFLPSSFRSMHVVVVGLDSAGKTSLLYRLKLQEFVHTIPTRGFNTERIQVAVGGRSRAVRFQVWDVGGQEKLRPLWRSYTRRTDGLVFVVDSGEPERVEEARAELHRISRSPENQGVPVLIAANKQDLPSALSAAQLEKLLGVQELGGGGAGGGGGLHHVQGCSAVDGQGLQAGLEKLHDMILKRRKQMKHSKVRRR
ncbi:hypothetical protein NHX12_024704 [Muraenolepis orangiensis]|uniref:ADP-ribosylation factor-like protein 14 n=1 Tax=Muraenolepis orangiensis TaxID=630683 RepID=A0A9Q0ELG3_9TELE|nr:hypothetical protein NHX12_024704 [Muraenolepis orangiensis]